jgi:septum formation protein
MLLDNLKKYRVMLASKSPRRQELLRGLGVDFEIGVSESEERILPGWKPSEAVCQLARQKAEAVFRCFSGVAGKPLLVIGGDTIVCVDGLILGKPHDLSDAERMLRLLSGQTHKVYTGLCVMEASQLLTDYGCTSVTFESLSEEEISHYIARYRPYDKAGAYGVQEWVGFRGISRIEGSFYNVMGLPTHLLWEMLGRLCENK